jgi:hypothetical protein
LCFGEIFEHGRRLLFEFYDLAKTTTTSKLRLKSPRRNLPRASEAWISTQVMLGFTLAVLDGAERKRGGSPASPADAMENLSVPAGLAFARATEAFSLLGEHGIFDGDRPVPEDELLSTLVSMCIEDAKRLIKSWS